jgi:hypothetical protein
VDSRLPALGAPAWRTATLVASAVAALELVLLVVAGFVLLAKPLSRHGDSAAKRPASAAAVKAKLARVAPVTRAPERMRAPSLGRSETSVLVLNGNGLTGAAGTEAARVKQLGYTVARVGDAGRMDYPASVVMYRPGFKPEGVRLARDLGIDVVGPLDGVRVRELRGAQAAVIVGH